MSNYNELMKKLDEYGGAMVFLNGFREILSKYNLTPELIADILQRGEKENEPTSARSGKLFNRASS
ncbi:hypothetical protein U1295_10685 [Enterococcus cecorum]|uniref:hypothetical protein n=1 Tax=Enterococcus cecorum TaxID=44008 RepID=UPI002ACAFE6D|nr:hypothetical protein [Enterococcus cecorum]MDZ5576453.1 hypothetical protein [Enterococcus cecorum]